MMNDFDFFGLRIALRKVWRDLWRNKGRTLLVVLSIAVGVMTVGTITASSTQLQREIARSQAALTPSHVWLSVSPPAPQSVVDSVANLDGVVAAVGYLRVPVRYKPAANAPWDDGFLVALPSYTRQRLDLVTLLSGEWPGLNTVAVEAGQIAGFDLPTLGGTLYLDINNRDRELQVSGLLRDPYEMPPPFAEQPTFFVTRTMFERLVGISNYTQIRFLMPQYDEAQAEIVVEDAKDQLERQNVTVNDYDLHDPTRHLVQDVLDGVLYVLQVLAVLSLGLSVFLVVNTMNALVSQQVPQIGIMKTVGGLTRQILVLYLAGVIIYGLLSLALAVPLGAIGAYAMTIWMLGQINVPPIGFEVVSSTLLLQIAAGLLTPLLAALWPVGRGVAVSVREALNQFGVGAGYGTRTLDRLLGRIRTLPRMLALALRNTFRNMGRVLLTEFTLIAAGAIFMMVQSTSFSFNYTIDKIFDSFGYDVIIGFQQPQRIEEVQPMIAALPNVERVEMWLFGTISASVPGIDTPGNEYNLALRGVPVDTQLFEPELTAGRDLLPNDGRALLLNQRQARRMNVTVGDTILLDINGKESTWTIVGLIFDLGSFDQDSFYVHRETIAPDLSLIGRASVVEVRLIDNSFAAQKVMETQLREMFDGLSMPVGFSQSADDIRRTANAQFGTLTTILLIMTLLIAAVGAIGLSGILSINVLERRREIGVMRAVGASSFDIAVIFMSEGLLLGVLSWALAIPVSYLAAGPFIESLGVIVDFPFVYQFSLLGVWQWLAIVSVLAVSASWLPARRATEISVRESLSYE